MKRLTVGIYALHYVLYLCTLNKSRLAGAASLTNNGVFWAQEVAIYFFE